MAGTMRAVSCVIVTYDSASTIDQCAELVSPHVEEIIIVDNDSTDATPSLLSRLALRLPNARIFSNSENLGFATAANRGITEARVTNDVLLLNPDCFIDGDALAMLGDALDSQSSVGVAGASIRNIDGSEHPAARRAAPNLANSFLRAFRLRSRSGKNDLELTRNRAEKIADVDAVSGACMLVRREALEQVGLLDADFFLHCEDLDWCVRFRRHGWRVVVVNDAFATHIQGVSGKGRHLFVEYHKHRGMFRYYSKHVRPRARFIVTPIVFAGIWSRFTAVATNHLIRRIARFR
jgi:GT2 family glycosyltransferase